MKRTLSIPALWVRMTFRGAVGIIAVMAAVELILYRRLLPDVAAGHITLFSAFTDRMYLTYIFRAAVALMFFWLVLSCRAESATMGRLSVSQAGSTVWYAAVVLCWFVILYAAQIGTVRVACRWFYGAVDPAAVSGQSLMIACYESTALHGLLPLSDWLAGVTMAVLFTGLSVSVAVDTHAMRRSGGFPLVSGILAAVTELMFGRFGAGVHWVVLAGAVLLTAYQIVRLVLMAVSAGRGDGG